MINQKPPFALPYDLTPAQVAELSGADPEIIRAWRNRGLIAIYGQGQENGRWAYSLQDATGFYIARRLFSARMDRDGALRLGFTAANSVIAAMRGDPVKPFFATVYTISPTVEADGNFEMHGWTVAEVDSLAEVEKDAVMIDKAINIADFAARAPSALREAAQALRKA